MRGLMLECAPFLERDPSVIGPERFPRHSIAEWPDYPFGGGGSISSKMDRPAFQKFITRARSFCLRVSGAVAPSAPSFAKAMEGVSREGSCGGHPRAPPADEDVARHHRGGRR